MSAPTTWQRKLGMLIGYHAGVLVRGVVLGAGFVIGALAVFRWLQ